MKSKTFFFSKAILLGMILAAVCGALSGQTKPDARGFDSGVYDYHFRRADRETGAEQWIAEARQGIRMAKSAWELAATELYGDRALLMEAGAGIDAWSEAELEARFTQWLLTRFFGSGTAGEDAARQIRSAGLPYMYHLDENGNILYDGASGDPLVIRPGEGEVEAEQARWREEAEGIADAESSRYEARLAALFPELLAYIPEERRDAFAERLEGLAREAASGRRREFEALIAREERLLTARRTGDVWSLRKKSEGEAASMIAGQLIEEAGAFCTQGIAELQERIEAAAAGTGDLALAGSEWLDAYREQFERGIKAWEEAEERFFIRRIEWEQEAGQHYLEGEAAWSGAFTRLEQERRNWEAKAKALFESGALLFRQASEHLEAAISEAKAEFEGDALIRMEAGAGRAKAWVDSYITCGSMAAAARENIEFWLTRYPNKDAPSLSGGAFSRWIAGELASNTDAGSLATARELKQWSDLYDTYMGKAQEARDALIRDFNLVMGTGRLVDIVDEGAVSEDFNLDEYQIELIRAKAVAGYWEKRLAIAEEVIAYAEELSAGRMTEGEGIKAWEEAKARYDAALLRYDAEVSRLNAAGTGVAGAQEALYEAAASLRESESVLEEMNRSYAILMASYAVGRNDFILDDLAAKYRELLERSGLLRAGGDTAVYIRYLEQARALGFAQELESAGNTLKQLVLGGEGIGKSLSALAEAASKIRVLGEDEPVPHSIGDFGIGEDDPAYEVLKALLWEQAEQCSRAAPAEQEDIRAGYDRLIRGLVKTARAQAQTLLENRLRAMDLLTASSTADWYFSMQGREAEAAEKAAFVTRGLEFNLVRDDEEARRALLTARLTLELEGLSLIAGEAAGGGRAELLARFCLLAPGDAAECREALRELQMILDSAGDGTLQTSLDAALDAAAQGNLFISWFLREGSFFGTPSGQPLTYAFLTEELAALSRSQGLLEIYGLIGSQARAAVRETGLRALQGMGEVFRSFGVALNGEGLPGVKALADALTGRAGPVEQNLSALLSALDGHAASLPAWIRGELPAWRNALIDYIAARLAASGRTMSASGTQLAQRAEANQARIGQVEAVHEILLYAAPGSARALSAALELDPALFTLLNPDELADEAVRRIAADLAAGSGPVAPEAAEAALQAAAARYHGYAPAAIRDRAVEEAIRIITGEAPAGETAAEGDSYHELLAEELTALYGTLSRQGQRVADEYALWAAIDALQKTIAAAGQEGKSHWRSYITAEFLRDYNDNSKNQGNPLNAGVTGQAEGDLAGVKAAASWQEGLLADAYEEASQATRMLNRGFLMMASGTPAGWEEFQEGSRGYQDDPLRAWDDALIKPVEYGYYDSYYLEGSELRRQYAYRQSLEQEIQRLGAGYNKSKQSGGVIKAELEALSDTITAQQEAHSRKIGSYEAAARAFASAGAAYDGIYEAVKRDYGALEDARFAYEIQDAVRRWASTAYLGTTDASTAAEASAVHYKNPYEELSYARERYTRSDTALRALAALYDSGESRRPYADREYEALYAEYTKSFQRMLTASKALSVLEGAIAEEIERNNNYYHAYMEYLGDLGQPLSYASDYQVPADKSLRQIQDFLRIKNGNL
ncbi:MAG: hypothetical protein LBU28_04520, partial [Spirochaetaceae bacterium]|nr:hypothetical protein [Spirochaetaceae bacterium]